MIGNYISKKINVSLAHRNIFSHFYFAENKDNETISRILIPSYQSILILNFGNNIILNSKKEDEIIVDKFIVLNTIKKAFEYSLPPNSKLLVINFNNDAFYRFFGVSHVVDSNIFTKEYSIYTLWLKLI